MGKILLFYTYVSIAYPKRILKWQKKICSDLELRGRIFIAPEGINGTVGGTEASIDQYIAIMEKHELFHDIDFKISSGDADYFPRMEIKVKKEVVRLGIEPELLPANQGGIHITPQEAHALLSAKPKDLVIFDARNNFESRIGAFTNSLMPDICNFSDLPAFIDQRVDLFKDKQVLMYCTGGIRCERASAYLKTKKVAKQVMQLKGGIIRYVEQYPNGFFRGKNYVFDRRVAVPVTDDILTHCDICRTQCDEYTNCFNADCNNQYIACNECLVALGNCCSAKCHELVANGTVATRPLFVKAPAAPVTPKK